MLTVAPLTRGPVLDVWRTVTVTFFVGPSATDTGCVAPSASVETDADPDPLDLVAETVYVYGLLSAGTVTETVPLEFVVPV
jgi:hypothetical protein